MTGKPEHLPENLILVIGQILEATTSASEGIKLLSTEVQKNAQAVITAANTIEIIEQRFEELESIIRDTSNSNNLIKVVQEHSSQITQLGIAIKQLKAAISTMKRDVEKTTKRDVVASTQKQTLRTVGLIIAWVIGTFIAIYGALTAGK